MGVTTNFPNRTNNFTLDDVPEGQCHLELLILNSNTLFCLTLAKPISNCISSRCQFVFTSTRLNILRRKEVKQVALLLFVVCLCWHSHHNDGLLYILDIWTLMNPIDQ